ncbi:Ctr copper transporter family-domain-containing protein [Paraphoma chrysanthemicola]|nr:Ctr copper transporter family-domain-containing protein [Paraphoma chrysanthemicola]
MNMDMSMSMDMGATATNTMSMATSTPMPTSMSGMPMMGMDSMEMVFFSSTTTPLWSSYFTPHNTGQYAGICIFLIAFATIFRLLVAFRVNIFAVLDAAERRQYGGLLQHETKTTIRPWRANEAVLTAALDVLLAGVSYLLMLAVMTLNVGYFLSILGGVFLGSMACGRLMGSYVTH